MRTSVKEASTKEKSSVKRKWWTKPKTLIPFLVAVLTLVGLLVDLPKNLIEFCNFIVGEKIYLRGRIVDSKDSSVAGAVLKLEEVPGDSAITTSDGGFYFPRIPGKPDERMRLYVYAKEHRPYNQYVTLPGPVSIKLEE